jgi:glycosyltransferase involved in cell wall biosynthesis
MIHNKKNMINVLITSPSTNARLNIGGISSVTRLLIENNPFVRYRHFVRGKKDSEKRGIIWLLRQPLVLAGYVLTLIKSRNLKIVHINMPLEKNAIIRDSALVMLSFIMRKKIIVHFHGGNFILKNKIPFFLEVMVNAALAVADRIITLGETEKDYFKNKFGVDPSKILCLPNSVSVPAALPQKPDTKKIRILYMGRIDRNKGLDEMISVFEMLKYDMDIELIIAGSGPDQEYFLNECENRIPGKYKFLGVISGQLKDEILQTSHIFLLLSYYEGLPYALLEAMANRLVPIVTGVGSIPEIITDRENGFLVPVHDFELVYHNILEMKANRSLMDDISKNAYNTALNKYSMEEYINKINSLYSNVASA